MTSETVEMRMAKLEHGCERIDERLGLIERRLTAIEPRLASGVTSLRYELMSALDALRTDVRTGDAGLCRQVSAQFYWLLAVVVGSILVPLLRDLAR